MTSGTDRTFSALAALASAPGPGTAFPAISSPGRGATAAASAITAPAGRTVAAAPAFAPPAEKGMTSFAPSPASTFFAFTILPVSAAVGMVVVRC